MTAALQANGYYNCNLDYYVSDADYVYETMAGGEWTIVYNEEWGYDEWVWEGNDELTFEQFEESYMDVADWYGLTEYDLGFVLLGMADADGDWMVTEAEL